MILIAVFASLGVALMMAADMAPPPAAPAVAPAPVASAPVSGGDWSGLATRYPEFTAGLQDCLDHLTLQDAADLTQRGQALGTPPSFAIFYPELKQPHDFVVAVSSTPTGDYTCSGQGPVSVASADLEAELPGIAALAASYNMVELAFPAPNRAFADCEGLTSVLLNDTGGTTVFAGFVGANAQTYCTAFGVKE